MPGSRRTLGCGLSYQWQVAGNRRPALTETQIATPAMLALLPPGPRLPGSCGHPEPGCSRPAGRHWALCLGAPTPLGADSLLPTLSIMVSLLESPQFCLHILIRPHLWAGDQPRLLLSPARVGGPRWAVGDGSQKSNPSGAQHGCLLQALISLRTGTTPYLFPTRAQPRVERTRGTYREPACLPAAERRCSPTEEAVERSP